MIRNLLIAVLSFLSIGFFVNLGLTPSAYAQTATPVPTTASCPVPAQVQNVKVEYPGCTGTQCSFANATCSWGASTDATQYQLTITEVETNTSVKNEKVPTTTTTVTFPVTQGKTYKCNVSGVNACGTSGVAGSYSLLCETDALLEPTAAPTAPPAKPTAKPTLPPAGAFENTIIIGAISLILLTLGAMFVIL